MEKIKIGGIQKPHGLKGEVKIFIETDFVEQRFKAGNTVIMDHKNQLSEVTIESSRYHHGLLIVKFQGFDSIEAIEPYQKAQLYVNKETRHELAKDDFYFSDLLNLGVYKEGVQIGVVNEVMDMPAHPVLRVEIDGQEILIPFNKTFVASVSLEEKRIDVNWMEGL